MTSGKDLESNKLSRRNAFALTAGVSIAALALAEEAKANTVFTSYAFPATNEPTSRTMPDRLAEVKNVMDFGALGDGTGALLSTRYGSLGAAQAVYPFVTSTGVTIDWTAITAAVKWNSLYTTATVTKTAITTTFSSLISYNSGTGAISITCAGAHGLSAGQLFIITSATGTGAGIAALTGNQICTGGAGTTLNFTIGTGLTISAVTGGNVFGTHTLTLAATPAAVQSTPQNYTVKDLNQSTPLIANLNCNISSTTSTTITLSQPLLLDVTNGDIIEFVAPNVGTVYIPSGDYRTNSPIDYDGVGSVIFRGDGIGSKVGGGSSGFAGYIFDRPGLLASGPGIRVFEKLYIFNASTSVGAGAIRLLGNDGGAVRDCQIQAHVGVNIGGAAPSDTSFDTHVEACLFNGLGTWESGSIGVMLGGQTAVYDSAIVGWEHGVRAYGAGTNVIGCRIERNKAGIYLGLDIADSPRAVNGAQIHPYSMEANDVGIYASIAVGCDIGGFTIQGGTSAPSGNSTHGIRWENGTNNTFHSLIISGDPGSFTTAGFSMNTGSTHASVFDAITSGSQGAGPTWVFTPSPEYTFRECNNPTNAFPFSSLPTPVEGMEFDITDGTDSLAWGAIATNTGTHTTHYKVRYNGSNWTVMGK